MINISSPAFTEGEVIPSKYTCDGENINPPLEFSDIHESTASLTLIVSDPDAPDGEFTHWIVYNIDPKDANIREGKSPAKAIEGLNTAGQSGYTGPCPPSGSHRYYFMVYALDIKLEIPAGADRRKIEEAIAGHVIDQAELMGRYEKA